MPPALPPGMPPALPPGFMPASRLLPAPQPPPPGRPAAAHLSPAEGCGSWCAGSSHGRESSSLCESAGATEMAREREHLARLRVEEVTRERVSRMRTAISEHEHELSGSARGPPATADDFPGFYAAPESLRRGSGGPPFKPADGTFVEPKPGPTSESGFALTTHTLKGISSQAAFEREAAADQGRSLAWRDEMRRFRGLPNAPAIQTFMVSSGRPAPGIGLFKLCIEYAACREEAGEWACQRARKHLHADTYKAKQAQVDGVMTKMCRGQVSDVSEIQVLFGGVSATGHFTLVKGGMARGTSGDPTNAESLINGMRFTERVMSTIFDAIFGVPASSARDDGSTRPSEEDVTERWGLEEMTRQLTSLCDTERARIGVQEFFDQLEIAITRRIRDPAAARKPFDARALVKETQKRVEAELKEDQSIQEKVDARFASFEAARAAATRGGAGGSSGGGGGSGGDGSSEGGSRATMVVCKNLDGMAVKPNKLGAVRLAEASLRRAAGDKEWKTHRPPSESEPCPWLGLFGVCESEGCKRCKKGAQPMEARALVPIRAAFEQAAKHSAEARETLSAFTF